MAFARGGPPTLYPPSRLSDVVTVHAMTVHRGQGSQFRRVTVVLPPAESPLLTRELLYTAVTRAREHVRVVGSAAAVRAAVRAAGEPGQRPAAPAGGLTGGRPGADRTIRGGPDRRKAPAGRVQRDRRRGAGAATSGRLRTELAITRRRRSPPTCRAGPRSACRGIRRSGPGRIAEHPGRSRPSVCWTTGRRWRSVAITHGELEHTGAAGWAGLLPPPVGAGRGGLRGVAAARWAGCSTGRSGSPSRGPPAARCTPLGGRLGGAGRRVVHVYGYGLTTLPAGVHIVGLQAFRLVLAELGFVVPDGLTEASTVRPDELRRRLRATPPTTRPAASRPTCWPAAPTRCCCAGWRPPCWPSTAPPAVRTSAASR